MQKYRLIYGVIWLIAVIAYSIPWAQADGETFTGWAFTIPFSLTYLIGLLFGLIVLISKKWSFGLSLASGILMIVGVAGGVGGAMVGQMVGELAGREFIALPGIGFAFLWSIIYTVVAPVVGKKMKEKSYKSIA